MGPLKWLRIDCYGEEEQMKQASQYRGVECWNSSKLSGLTGGLFFFFLVPRRHTAKKTESDRESIATLTAILYKILDIGS